MPELAASHIKMIFQPEAKAQLLLLCVQPNCWKSWCPGAESNHRHRDFQSRALPTELPGRRPGGQKPGRKRRLIETRLGTVQPRPAAAPERKMQGIAGLRGACGLPCRSALLLGLGLGPRVFLPLGRRDRIAAGEPAVQIDVGAALRAERPKPRRSRLAADRAFARAGNRIGHAGDIGMAGAEGKSTPPGRRRRPTSPDGEVTEPQLHLSVMPPSTTSSMPVT